ncbi:MAG: S41 family peptidase [Gemmatimonadetes bacterium]|nr:S41 family peptidase [Gemmatimonadota bacterium]
MASRWALSALRVCSLAVLLAAGCVVPARSQAVGVQPGAEARVITEVAAATFDSAWTRIRNAHYDTTFNGIDWDAVRAELRPRAVAAVTLGDLRAVVLEMLGRLGESHYTLIPQEFADAVDPERIRAGDATGVPGDVGLELRVADGRLVAWRIDPGGPAANAGVRPGWIVDTIDGRRPEQGLSRVEQIEDSARRKNALTQFLWAANASLDGPAGTRVNARFIDELNHSMTIDLERRRQPGEPVRFGNLPAFFAELAYERITRDGECIGIIRFNIWMVPLAARFDRAVDALRDCAGVIIDLRGNPGGVAGMVMGVAGHFMEERVALGTMRSRGTELNFVPNPRRVSTAGQPVAPFAGPLAVLVDGLSVSTSEMFAGGLQAIGRARIFGETTAGQALPATLWRLPSGDVLMYVVADFTAAGGIRLEGRGVIPDEAVPLRRADLVAGRDAALDAALAWLAAVRRTSDAR